MLASSSGTVAPGYGTGTQAGDGADDRAKVAERPDPPPLRPRGPGSPPPGRPGDPGTDNGRGRHPKHRRRRSERILRWALAVAAVILVIAGAGYGYVRYRWAQVKTQACSTCSAVADGQPFNVLLVGSDSRAGNTGAAAQAFGSSSQVGGQRSDTLKILHVDPASGTARLLSIPRDTFVEMSDIPTSSGLSGAQKINTAFNSGPGPLIATIQNTFGIPIAHFVEIDFQGLTDAVNTVGGIYLNFPYPARDNDNGNNNSGLNITHSGCQLLNGTMTLALARSRFYQYYADGYWHYDPSSDLGRIERQNIIIQAVASRARKSFNPLTLNAFLGAVVHDVTVDQAMTFGDMLSLGLKYHAFSPSSLQSFTLPTVPEVATYAGDVEVVDQPAAENVLTRFLGAAPGAVSTPPLTSSETPIYPPPPTTTTTGPASGGSSGGSSGSGPTPAPSPSASASSFDPTVCSG
ncbi:MAG TPA: LCP family protein [Acidimicrobiales bacterium]|nr:LCP family protein [Acidimicrobiales bacterium]